MQDLSALIEKPTLGSNDCFCLHHTNCCSGQKALQGTQLSCQAWRYDLHVTLLSPLLLLMQYVICMSVPDFAALV